MNVKALHYVAIVLGAIVALCSYLAGADPAWTSVCHAIAGICGALLPVLGALSPSVMTATNQAAVNRAAAKAAAVATLVVIGGLVIAGLASACTKAQLTSGVQDVQSFEPCIACVGKDAIANEQSASPVPFYPQLCTELVHDCGSVCGTDFVGVIGALASSTDPAVKATAAYHEASARRAAMLAPAPAK